MAFRILCVLAVFTVFACSEKEEISVEERKKIDDQAIQKYIADNNLQATKHSSGLYYVINEPGGEEKPVVADNKNVKVHYHGYLLNGSKFDSSIDRLRPFYTPLTRVIEGWKIGIPLFGKGGKGMLLIPSHLGYGPLSPSPSIPVNSVLIFEIHLLDFD